VDAKEIDNERFWELVNELDLERAMAESVAEGPATTQATTQDGDTPQAPSPRVDQSRPNRSDIYWSSTQNANATTLRTCKVDDIYLSILIIATPGDLGLSRL
jgi:hypothetical protein